MRDEPATHERRDAPSLDGGFRACFLELLLDRLGLVLLDAFLDGARRTFDEVLRFLQTKTGDRADDLDDGDLVLAERVHHDVELGLLLDGRCSGGGTARGGDGDGRGGGNAPLLFERFHELDDLEDRLLAQRFDQLCIRQRHDQSPTEKLCYLKMGTDLFSKKMDLSPLTPKTAAA